MKLLAIRGENLASLAAPFEIDLAEGALAASGLFAITGPTGAGKSTVLDAICLALYGAAPRLEQASQRRSAAVGPDDAPPADPRNIMRHGAGEAYAEVEFLGRPESAKARPARRRYRARWTARRARGAPNGALQPPRMSLIDLETGAPLTEKLTETRAAIAARIGLSFEQFRRSVMLAQGDFEAFLRSEPAERALLLERITGGAIFSAISKEAYRRAAAETAALRAMEAALEAHAILSPEARIAAETEAAARAAAAHTAQARREKLEAAARRASAASARAR
ncbi:MAG: AAA family ATPase, partial [Pseudomonadota bacterium]